MHKTKRFQAMSRSTATERELTEVPLFADLSAKQLRWASQLTTPLDLPAGHVLARQGSVGAEFFVVLEGVVEVVRSSDLIATRGPGSPLGEIALLGARPRTATLVAQTPVRARVASQREFSGLLAEVPELSQRLHAIMIERLAA
jgi:CRP-like cAMP-binding protein